MPPTDDTKRRAARETIDILAEMSALLNTHLDRQSLSYCVSLIENGVNPEALANTIHTLRAKYPSANESVADVTAGAGR
ncbi:hypothetical protein K461DRAFT_293369 [Myriangium duriaei CBS 260.36]|uniref:Mitotic-spindle organizing protein 1 n=1 Tax=Myriangium duriaei CBS 260.36 TaxID=1168546 RepID=A0A9P4J423_9PEZI|nr:hypothetical protein K461DRAFT_293369 [Myriangium duriaei CBS 260.36]